MRRRPGQPKPQRCPRLEALKPERPGRLPIVAPLQECLLPGGRISDRGASARVPSRLARDAVGKAPSGGACLGSLGCAEAHDCLDEADCSSVDTDEGFVVYQSPLSMAAQGERGAGGDDGARDGCGAPTPPVLVEQLPPRLARDPDLAEMLRCVVGAAGLAVDGSRGCLGIS